MVDLSFLEKFTKGDSKKIKRYISLYLDVAPKTIEEMERNLQAKDWEQLRINAHSLKPQTDFMGLTELKEKLVRIEEAVKSNELSNIYQLLNDVQRMHSQSVNSLKDAIENKQAPYNNNYEQ